MPNTHCKMEPYHLPTLDGLRLVKGLCEGVLLGKDAIAGFPSLNTISHGGQLGFHGVNIFQSESKNETMVITLENGYDRLKVEEVARALLGKRIYVGWPYLQEARVSKVTDELFTYNFDDAGRVEGRPQGTEALVSFRKLSERLEHVYSKRMGTIIGNVEVILQVQLLKGMKRLEDGSLVKDYEEKEVEYALQTTCENVSSEDPRFMEKAAAPIEQEYPEGCRVFFLGGNAYGVPSQVLGHHNNTLAVRIAYFVHDRQEHFLFKSTLAGTNSKSLYFPSPNVARAIGISSLALAKITSTLMVMAKDGKTNIGLGLKFEAKGQKVLGYTRKGEMGWDFSQKAVELVEEYNKLFPEVARAIDARRDPTTLAHFFPGGDGGGRLQEIRSWLKKKGVTDLERVPLYADQLDPDSVKTLESLSDRLQSQKTPEKMKQAVIKGIPRTAVLKPDHTASRLQGQTFGLGDRVIMVSDTGNVPLSAKGVVIGVQSSLIDVVFDVPFMAGSNLGGRCSDYRGASILPTAILNLSTPQKVVVTPRTGPAPPPLQRAPHPHANHGGPVTRGRQVGGPALVPSRGLPAGGFHPARGGRGRGSHPTILTNPSRLQHQVTSSPTSASPRTPHSQQSQSDRVEALRNTLTNGHSPAPHQNQRGRGGPWLMRGGLGGGQNWNVQSPSDPPPFNRARGMMFRGRGRGRGSQAT
ncbi:hypothetical protein BT69DRAFT_1093018 [Atractiella rhizophila]|nr:hypothetical protein BT69DRAFT_1093018 [Atractiella rhizophila]